MRARAECAWHRASHPRARHYAQRRANTQNNSTNLAVAPAWVARSDRFGAHCVCARSAGGREAKAEERGQGGGGGGCGRGRDRGRGGGGRGAPSDWAQMTAALRSGHRLGVRFVSAEHERWA